MMKEEICDAGGDGGNNWARVCDMCRSVACTVYCRADSAYLCAGCDARVHAANRVASCHEHVRVCEACERAPAAFLCKADAASLCTACDADIHSANPLARRHHRVPILPIPGCLYVPSAAETEDGFMETEIDETIAEEDEEEAASWLLLNPGKNSTNQNTGFLFSGEVDEYLDLVEYNSSVESQFTDQYNQLQQHYGGDSVVPIQSTDAKDHLKQKQHQTFQFGLGYDSSKAAYSYNGSISHSELWQLSVSSVDHEVVPESSMSYIPISHTRPFKGTTDLFSGPSIQMPSQLTPLDREARVLRYREKKKTRKFEKTIRYASRKAYAEMRPRIKGRFVKRMDAEVEVDQMSLMMETGYGIVPTF